MSGGSQRKFTPEQVADAIVASAGVVVQAAYRLRANPDTIYEYAKAYPEVAETLRVTREEALDLAESKLWENVRAGNLRAIIFYLSNTREGAKRGYSARTELVAVRDQPVTVNVSINRVESRKPTPEPVPLDTVPFNRTPEYRRLIREISG